MQNLIDGCLLFPLCHLEKQKQGKTPEFTATLDQIPVCILAEIILLLSSLAQGSKHSTGFPLVDRDLLCKWPALQSLQDPKAVSSPAPIGLKMGGMPRYVWVVLPNDTSLLRPKK